MTQYIGRLADLDDVPLARVVRVEHASTDRVMATFAFHAERAWGAGTVFQLLNASGRVLLRQPMGNVIHTPGSVYAINCHLPPFAVSDWA